MVYVSENISHRMGVSARWILSVQSVNASSLVSLPGILVIRFWDLKAMSATLCSETYSHSFFSTQSHTHTLADWLSHTLKRKLDLSPLSASLTFPHPLSISLALSSTRARALSLSLSDTQTHRHTDTHTQTCPTLTGFLVEWAARAGVWERRMVAKADTPSVVKETCTVRSRQEVGKGTKNFMRYNWVEWASA